MVKRAWLFYREHEWRPGPGGGCWWYSSAPSSPRARPGGRFDLREPEGTCYLASTDGAAVRERVGRLLATHRPIPEYLYTGRVVSQVVLPDLDGPVADLTSEEAAALGVTVEIHSSPDYRLTARWAAQAHADGFGGLRYQPRFTPGGAYALALFGPNGSARKGIVVTTEPLVDLIDKIGYKRLRVSTPSTAAVAARVDDGLEPDPDL